MQVSYKDSGVDIDAGNQLVSKIKNNIQATFDKNVIGGIGSFAGAYELPTGYKKPVILGATDGVGTKLKLAIESKKFDTIGIDLVAMCVNDLICNFATPMFFLDYYATSKLDIDECADVVSGISKGCIIAGCSLIGGETAEMPGIYKKDDFDLAGFCVGIAEKDELNPEKSVERGDKLVAIPSSGLHSNGYSLARHLLFDKLNMSFDEKIGNKKLIDILIEPTRIYVDDFKKLKSHINSLAHITGGGLIENVPRALPKHLNAQIDYSLIKSDDIFEFMKKYVDDTEMKRTFNLGVGMVLTVNSKNIDFVLDNSDGYVIGEVV